MRRYHAVPMLFVAVSAGAKGFEAQWREAEASSAYHHSLALDGAMTTPSPDW